MPDRFSRLAQGFVVLVALLHIAFFVLEAFLWTGPVGQRIFGMSAEEAEHSALLAMNQGVYNLLLALGLFWCLVKGWGKTLTLLLLGIILVGIFGAVTVKPSILITQALPAFIAAILVQRSSRKA